MSDEHIRAALKDLPDKQRRRFVLWCYFGLTYEQIGAIEGCRRQTVTRSIDKAREQIKGEIKNFEIF